MTPEKIYALERWMLEQPYTPDNGVPNMCVIKEAIAELRGKAEEKTCKWKKDSYGNYDTECGKLSLINPICCCQYCGGKVEVVR